MFAMSFGEKKVIALALAACAQGCSPARRPAEEELRRLFPEQTDLVAGARVHDGSGMRLTLPARASERISLALPGGPSIEVRELGCWGGISTRWTHTSYDCDDHRTFWRESGAGQEEWLLFDGDVLDDDVARWRVDGGELRQHGRSVDVLDADGTRRFTVSAPIVFSPQHAAFGATLEARADTIVLHLDERPRGPVLVDPVWVPAGSMSQTRRNHTATALADGRVLAAGGEEGFNNNVLLATAELWDPKTKTWSSAPPMPSAHIYHTATRLKNDRVLIAGWQIGTVFDPLQDKWILPSAMQKYRAYHGADLLIDGTVLVAGGENMGPPGAERYDPNSNSWTATTALMISYTYGNTVTALPDGRALVSLGPDVSTSGIYDPVKDAWQFTPPAKTGRAYHAAARLGSGRILFAGGTGQPFGLTKTAEIYDPAANSWTLAQDMSVKRYELRSAILPGGNVIIVGGQNGVFDWSSTEIYDETTNSWNSGPTMIKARSEFGLASIGGGELLAVGGLSGIGTTAESELFSDKKGLGVPCMSGAECATGFCVEGLCCDTACNTAEAQCQSCTKAKGAWADGTCTFLAGEPCDADGDRCTAKDKCTALGKCVAGNPVICPKPDQCHEAGTCDPKTGTCSSPANKTDGSPCDDGVPCTHDDHCTQGACAGAPVVCDPVAPCASPAYCDPNLGECVYPPQGKPEFSPCDDNDACTSNTYCIAGACQAYKTKQCPAPDECHVGVCQPSSGDCLAVTKPDGSSCKGTDPCMAAGSCQAGACVAAVPKCGPPPECHDPAPCSEGSDCVYPLSTDGSPCSAGSCRAGQCIASPRASASEPADLVIVGRGGCSITARRDIPLPWLAVLGVGLAGWRWRRRSSKNERPARPPPRPRDP